ncbi:MAG: UvrD-helicase domain-containing protein, partial [Clostridia bacterium]|nr:UvrD-helicase domain-containing protein [Clostridia bacterium]
MILTPEQERAISARGRIIVSASAGSGKTFVMINRLVELILNGGDVRRVLALTFTNKAAAQMRERLRVALIKRIGTTEGETRARLKEQLNALPLAEIGTVHAYCARLIRTYFYLTELDPSFRIVSPDDAEGSALSSRAIAEVFEEAYENGGEEFSDLLTVYFRKKKDVRLKRLVLSLCRAVRGTEDYLGVLARIGREDKFGEGCEILYAHYRARAEFLLRRSEEAAAYFAESNVRAVAV